MNWAAKEQIWIEVDEDQKKAYFGLPLDGSTVCNYRAVLDYFNGWEDPLVQTLTGDMIPNRSSRRWSVEPFAARYGKMVDRDLATSVDARIDDKQMLFGVAGSAPARIRMEVPDVFNDDGQPIDWGYMPAYAEAKALDMCNWEGVSGRCIGNGDMILTAIPINAEGLVQKASRRLALRVDENGDPLPSPYQGGEKVETDLFAYLFTNGNVADAWCEIQEAMFWYNSRYSARKNENLIKERTP